MKDEIKEILEYLHRCEILGRNQVLTNEEIKILLQHITNLQEENKRLNYCYSSMMLNFQLAINKIDKAINVLELSGQNKGICTRPETDTIQSALNVLNGGDKE